MSPKEQYTTAYSIIRRISRVPDRPRWRSTPLPSLQNIALQIPLGVSFHAVVAAMDTLYIRNSIDPLLNFHEYLVFRRSGLPF